MTSTRPDQPDQPDLTRPTSPDPTRPTRPDQTRPGSLTSHQTRLDPARPLTDSTRP